jgi:hypothetical protein
LDLLDTSRQLLREGVLRKRQGVENVDYNMFLFDHMLLIAKKKKGKDIVEYKIHKRPIPLEMIAFGKDGEDILPKAPPSRRTSSIFSGHARTATQPIMHAQTYMAGGSQAGKLQTDQNKGHQLTIMHLGRTGATHVFYANTLAERRQWREKIEAQRALLTDERKIFRIRTLTENTFGAVNRVTCSAVLCRAFHLLILQRMPELCMGQKTAFTSSRARILPRSKECCRLRES